MKKRGYISAENYFYMLVKIANICPGFISISILLSIFTSISPIMNIILLQYVMNMLALDVAFDNIVYILGLFLLFTTILSCIMTFLSTKVLNIKRQLILLEIKNEIFKVSECVSLETFDNPQYYDSLTIALQVAEGQAVGVVENFSTIISSLLSSGILITLIISIEPVLIYLSALSTLISLIYGVKSSKISAEFVEDTVTINRRNEYIQNIFTRKEYSQELRIFSSGELLFEHLRKNVDRLTDILLKQGCEFYNLFVQNSFFNNAILAIIIGMLSLKVINQNVSIGNIVAALSSSQQLSTQLMVFSTILSQLYQHGLFIEKYRDFLDKYGKRREKIEEDSIHLQCPANPDIELRNVYFRFKNGEDDILKQVTLSIKHGEHVAFVGPNGSGKSTLVKLIAGLYAPTRGEILINGSEYKLYDIEEVKKIFSFVFQDFKLFTLSIAENILLRPYKNSELIDMQMESALRYAGLKDKIDSLPEGVETELSKEFNKEGDILSGGELQKLAVARAYIQSRPVIIFDEATSSLDIEAERKLILASEERLEETTMIWVTHRPECLTNMDKIYYIENGRIVEQGKFDELMRKQGKFFCMFQSSLKYH